MTEKPTWKKELVWILANRESGPVKFTLGFHGSVMLEDTSGPNLELVKSRKDMNVSSRRDYDLR